MVQVAPRLRQETQQGRGQVHQLAEEKGGCQLQQHAHLEILSEDQRLRQDIEAVDGDGAVAQIDPARGIPAEADLIEHVGQAPHGADPQPGAGGKDHPQGHQEQAQQIDEQPPCPEGRIGALDFFHFGHLLLPGAVFIQYTTVFHMIP